MQKRYFVTGIGTGVGKTLISALLCEYLKADYFKPVQTGYPPDRDSCWIKNIVSYDICIHPECYLLQLPASPHFAAKREGLEIDFHQIKLPQTNNHLIIEAAGGLLVPLNKTHCIVDLIKHFDAECILVVSNYLGCINHSLLSLFYIQQKNIPLKGIILNGNFEPEVKIAITEQLNHFPIITQIPMVSEVNQHTFKDIYSTFIENLNIP